MDNHTSLAVDLSKDVDFLKSTWFDSQDKVFEHMRSLIKEGWHVTAYGLTFDCGNESRVARPLKVKGDQHYSGVGVWRFSGYDN